MSREKDHDRPTIARRRLLGTVAAASTAALAGCSISTPAGDIEVGTDEEPTTVSTVRTTTTTESTPTTTTTTERSTTTTEKSTTTTEEQPTTTSASNGNATQSTPPLTVQPCVTQGTCLSNTSKPTGLENESIIIPSDQFWTEPVFTPPTVISPVPVLPPTNSTSGGSTLKEPTNVANSGAVKVEVTPKQKDPVNTSVGGTNQVREGNMICTTQQRRITAGGGSNFLLNPELSTIWPGSILESESIARGQFSPALTRQRRDGASMSQIRQPIELSISLRNVDGKNTRKLETPTQGRYRTALDDLLGQYDRQANVPAEMNATIHQVHSSEQLGVTLGVHFDSPKLAVDNTFDFSSKSETNKLLAKFWQSYYTIDVSLPNPLANGFVTDQGKYLKRNDVIVKSVTYGRILLFSAESKYSRTKVSNALKVALNGGATSGKVNLDVKNEQVLRDTKIDVQVIGGAGTDGAKTISKPGEGAYNTIKNWIQKGAKYDPKTSPGKPIAYHTKYLSNFDTANTYLTTTYTERNCRPTTRAYRVHNVSWRITDEDDPGNEEEIYGDIYVVAFPFLGSGQRGASYRIEPKGGRSDGRVWHRSKSSHVNIRGGQRKDLGIDERIVFDDAHKLDTSRTYIQVTAIPREKDPTSNNDFGRQKNVKWFLNEAPSDPDRAGKGTGKFRETWNSHGSEIELAFDISPVPL